MEFQTKSVFTESQTECLNSLNAHWPRPKIKEIVFIYYFSAGLYSHKN